MSKALLSVFLLGALAAGGYALAGPDDPFEPGPPPPGAFEPGGGPGPHDFRPRGEFGGPSHRRDRMDEMSARVLEHEGEILERVQKDAPEQYERLMWLKKEYPEIYPMALGKIARSGAFDPKDPEAGKRMDKMRELRESLRAKATGFDQLSDKEQKARRTEMEGIARELFDLRQTELQARLDHASQKLDDARTRLKKRAGDRDKIIAQHLDRLILGPDEDL